MKNIICVFLLIFSINLFADTTPEKTIDRVQFNANTGSHYAFKSEGWGVCGNTNYVQLRGTEENKNIFVSHTLAAHMAQKTVSFIGSCTNSNGYLDAVYITINK